MARPTFAALTPGTAAWDAAFNDFILGMTARPFPIVVLVDLPTLTATHAAASYEDCIALVQTPTRALYVSDGTTWVAL